MKLPQGCQYSWGNSSALLSLVALLTALTGLASSAHALQAKPMEVLRGE